MAETIQHSYLGCYRLKLNPRFEIERYFLQKGSWEAHILEYFKYFIRPGSTCVDVGANSGLHTIAMAHYAGDTGKVYAFEPNSLTYPRLIDNVNLNQTLKSRIVTEKLGLSNTSETLKLYQVGETGGNAYMGKAYNANLWNSGDAEDFDLCMVMPLDEYLPDERIDVMKIDVEGMELEVLQGATRLLKRSRPVIIYETLAEFFGSEKVLETELFLRELGYLPFAIHPSLGKLMSVTHPKLSHDTIALHESEVIRYAEVIANAARYRCQGTADFPEFSLTLAGVDKDQFYAGIIDSQGEHTTAWPISLRGNRFEFTAELEGEPVNFSTEILLPDGKRSARPQILIDLSRSGHSVRTIGSQVGGTLFNYENPLFNPPARRIS